MARLSGSAVLLAIGVAMTLVVMACADEEDLYDVLGLGEEREDATERQIKSNWRKLSREHHPDIKGESSREIYKTIQRAYEVLSDRKKRKVYDMRGDEGLKQLEKAGAQQGHPQANDPFARFFGGGGGGGDGAQRTPNVEMVMLVTLEDTYQGASHTVRLNKQRLCKKCRGTGAASKADFQECKACKGQGHVLQRVQLAPGFVQQVQQPCGRCGGKGKVIKKKCPKCRGNKVGRVEQALSVDIEVGTPEGHKIVFDMEADQSPDAIPGDVIFTVQTANHKTFKRNGNDLELTVPLTLSQALLGFTKTVPHLDGHEVELSEAGITNHGTRRKIADEGMPIHHVPSEKGNLFVTYQIELPGYVSADQRQALEKIFPK
jgi:DnaJ-class molecular chaperone